MLYNGITCFDCPIFLHFGIIIVFKKFTLQVEFYPTFLQRTVWVVDSNLQPFPADVGTLSSRPGCQSDLYLQRYSLIINTTYTDTQKVAMLLGSIPPKLDRQQEKAWVLLTFPTCTLLIYSLQSHSRLTQPSVLSVPSPLAPSSLPTPSDDIHCQICHSPFDEHQMLLCDICNTGWHMDCLLPLLLTSPHGIWKCPLCLPRHLLPQPAALHLRRWRFFF